MIKHFSIAISLLVLSSCATNAPSLPPTPHTTIESRPTLKSHIDDRNSINATRKRVVLLPIRLEGVAKSYYPSIRSSVTGGLSSNYEVLAGSKVKEKIFEIYKKANRKIIKSELCIGIQCRQKLASELQSKLIATVTISKKPLGYFLTIDITDISDGKVVTSVAEVCKHCDEFKVIELLKNISGNK